MVSFNTLEEDGRKLTLAVTGELTIEHAGELKDALTGVVDRCTDADVDLGGVTEIDLSCIQALLSARISSSARHTALNIRGLKGKARSTLECGGFILDSPAAETGGGLTGGSDEQEDYDG